MKTCSGCRRPDSMSGHERRPGGRDRREGRPQGEALEEDHRHRQRQGEVHVRPDDRHRAAGRRQKMASSDGLVRPDRLDHRVGAAPAGGLVDLGHRVAVGGVDRLGAELGGAGEALGHHVDGEDAGGPVELRALQREHADRAEADHHHGVAGRDLGHLGAEVAGGEDVGEEHGLLVGDALGDLEHRRVGRRDGDGLGLAAPQVERGAEHLQAAVAAHDRVAGPARRRSGRSRPRRTPAPGRRLGR